MGRWDHLFDAKPQAAVEVLLDEASKSFAEDLAQWPPPLEGVGGGVQGAQVQALLALPRPHTLVYRQAFELARLDLRHDYDELDRWEREELWRSAQLTPEEKEVAVFLWRYLAERIFDLNEQVKSRLTRPQLVAFVDRIERRVIAPSLIV